jgi:hypothetical protein
MWSADLRPGFLIAVLLPILASMALANCASPAPAGAPVSALLEIEGEWDIVSFDGYHPLRLDADGSRHAFVDFSLDSASFAIECNFSGMTARIDESGRLVETPPAESIVTTMGCGRERERRESDFFDFFRSKPTVTKIDEGLLKLESPGTLLVLQRAEVRRLGKLPQSLAEIEGQWKAVIIYHAMQPGGQRNLLAPLEGEAANLTISGGSIRLAFDCEVMEQKVSFVRPGELSSAPGGLTRRTTPPCRIPQEDRDIAVSLISDVISVEAIDSSRLHIVSGQVRAVLERDAR